MPIYTFLCSECKGEMDVIRTMAESDLPPSTDEEIIPAEGSVCAVNKHQWTKIIKGAPGKKYGPSWGYVKGYGYRGNDW